jgi:VWFA-related protein
MGGRFISALLIFCLSPLALSQNGAPPIQTPDQTDTQMTSQPKGVVQRPQERPASRDTSGGKIGAMTLDVTVTDSAGKAVAGLTKSDFALLDNRQPATTVSFRATDGTTAIDPAQAILLLDEVNNSFNSVATERDQIAKYLGGNGGHLPIPISLALFSYSGVKIDQPTKDGNVLIAELEKMPIPVRTIDSAMGSEGSIERFQLSLKTLTQLLAYTGSKPGRKLLLWIGPGWPMMAGAGFGSTVGDKHLDWDSIITFSTDLRRARTTLYSVNSLSSETGLLHDVYYQNFLKPVTSAREADSGNLALPVLAVQSGGRVLNATNDLAGEIASCVADAAAYYTIAIQVSPSETVNDYHSLEAKLGKAEWTARTNSGYYNQPYVESPLSELQALAPAATLRTQVRLVALDALVLDRNGVPVTGLKASDFQLKEDGAPQKITSVEEHGPVTAKAETPSVAADGTITASNGPSSSPTIWNVLLVDQFNTSKEDLAAVRSELQQFLRQLPADEPVALVAMSSQIKILSSFENGAGAVLKYLDKNGLPPSNSSPPADLYAKQEELEMNPSPNPEMLANKARADVERQAQRAQTTLDNFSAIAKWLGSYPGRKNVYWLTAGFPLQGQAFSVLGSSQMQPTGAANHTGQTLPIQENTDKELESARVAIYPIEARGVAAPEVAGETSADTTGDFLSIRELGDKSIDVKQDNQLQAAQRSEMLEIAKATGGVASFNNDIAKTLRNDFKQGENFYTLAYTPSNFEWNGDYRKIALALQQPRYQLIYREGYYAKNLPPPPTPTKEEFRLALGRRAASATDVHFSAKVNKSTDSANVAYTIDSQTVQYQADPSGQLVAVLDCAIVEYPTGGKPIATSLVRLVSTVSPERRAALNHDGIRAKQSIALKPGAAFLVIGVRDQSTGRFGNLQLSLAAP